MSSFSEETRHCDRLGLELCDGLEELLHGPSGVDDVFDDQDVFAANGRVDALHADYLYLCHKKCEKS